MSNEKNTKFDRVEKIKEIFALTPDKINNRIIAPNIDIDLEGIVYITGFSGTGKTSLLKKLKKLYPDYEEPKIPVNQDIPIIEMIGTNIEDSIRRLGKVGLTEAFIYLTPYKYLSDGQKSRFLLADILMRNSKIFIIDEYLSNVDRITAKSVAYNFQKVCRNNNIKVVVATAHNDLVEALAPDTLIELDFNGAYKITKKPIKKPHISELDHIEIQLGGIHDYNSLKRFHYFGDVELSDEFDIDYYVYKYKDMTIGVSLHKAPYPIEWNEIKYFKDINERLRIPTHSIIHPSFRGIGLSLKLLRPNLSKYKYFEVRSALGLYMPRHLAAGYVKTDLPNNYRTIIREKYENLLLDYGVKNLNDFHDEKLCNKFLRSLTNSEKSLLRKNAVNLFAENLVNDYLYYRKIAELNDLNETEFEELKEFLLEVAENISTDILLQENVYFKMQGFKLKLNK